MNQTSTQSIFQSSATNTPKLGKAWQSYVGSGVAHTVIILLLLTITIPAIRPVRKSFARITIVAPTLPQPAYRVEVAPRPHVAPPLVLPPKLVSYKSLPIPIAVPKPLVTPPPVELKTVPAPQPSVEIKPELPPAPQPLVQTGVFAQNTEVAKSAPAPKLTVGGFGDPNGVPVSQNARPEPAVAKVGAFDAPNGAGLAGGGQHSPVGAVKASAFGSGGVASTSDSVRASNGQVRSSGFSDTLAPAPKKSAEASAQAITPVEILFKPRPAYTDEARSLRLEGHVSLEVVFLSSGSIRVVRVVHGLGHGLDEAAQQAAKQVRFKPAMRAGVAVDTNATINITFELS
jgi:TonB family protein